MRPQARQQIRYLLSDFITLNIGWFLFDVARFYTLPANLLPGTLPSFLLYPQLILGQILVPFGMIALYAVSGSHKNYSHFKPVPIRIGLSFAYIFK